MARKKEIDLVVKNQDKILKAAKELFLKDGMLKPQMNEIAKKAGMSKSTLYVYFSSKDEIINYITREAMSYFYEQLQIVDAMNIVNEHEQYMRICSVLVDFKEQYPLSFEVLVQSISVKDKELAKDPVLLELYQTGEKINELVIKLIKQNHTNVDVHSLMCIVFTQWGAVYGLITMADNKKEYIKLSMNLTKQQFLEQGFEQLYQVLKESLIKKGDIL